MWEGYLVHTTYLHIGGRATVSRSDYFSVTKESYC